MVVVTLVTNYNGVGLPEGLPNSPRPLWLVDALVTTLRPHQSDSLGIVYRPTFGYPCLPLCFPSRVVIFRGSEFHVRILWYVSREYCARDSYPK